MQLKLKKPERSRRDEVVHRWEDLVDEARHRLEDLDLDLHADDVRARLERAKTRAKKEVKPRLKAAARDVSETWDDLTDEAHDAKENLERWAGPTLKSLRSDLRDTITRIAVDVGDITRGEADRVIDAVERAANERRLQVEEEERRSRVKALVGWTVFGMVAGAVLALRFGPGGEDGAAEDHGPSIKDDEKYEALREDGMSKSKAAAIANAGDEASSKGGKQPPYEEWTKDELYERAQELDIDGRSDMDKDELIAALRDGG